MEDRRLLKQYLESGSQAAFGRLVEQYYRLVYSTCRRELGDNVLAEDAVQVVFLILARKAKSLRNEVVLGGWLFQTARFAAMDMRKQEIRRRLRDEKIEQAILRDAQQLDETWADIEPLLNDSLADLCEKDRVAVLLRFFESASFPDIAQALGQKEDAARHRVGRALAKMHRFLTRRGVAVPVSALATLLAVNALKPASAASAATLSSVIAGGSGANLLGSQVHLFAQGVLRTMWIKQVGTAAAILGAAIVISGVSAATGFGLVRTNATSLPAGPPRTGVMPRRAAVQDEDAASRPSVVVANFTPSAMMENPIIGNVRVVSEPRRLAAMASIDGIWEGEMHTQVGTTLTVLLRLSHKNGALVATLQSPDQTDSSIPASYVSFRHGVLIFRDNMDGASYRGTLSGDGKSVNGSLTQFGKLYPVVLSRLDRPTPRGVVMSEHDASAITGVWKGTLDAGSATLRIVVTISRDAAGLVTAKLQSPDQMPMQIPTILTYDKGVLDLTVNMVGGSYQGTVDSDHTAITGTWTQFHTPQPLNLTRAG